MKKNNNFDFLRFLFAVFVVISHSYPLSGSNETFQWIYQISNGQLVLARIGLDGFFIISGYFIFQSLQRSKTLFSYYKKEIDQQKKGEASRMNKEFLTNDYQRRFNVNLHTLISAIYGEDSMSAEYSRMIREQKVN